jgi:pimeloyl-ACP methyl ester carboxylesterase
MNLPGFQSRMVRVGDVNLHAVVGGSGAPLLLLHGFPQTWWEWRKVMPALARNYTVIAADLRGAGHSDCPAGGYDKATLGSDMVGLMKALGHEQFAVCGHDIGAMVAYALAATHRKTVTRLVILDVPIPGVSFWDSLFADPRVWHFAFHMKPNLPELLLKDREYEYVSAFIHDRAYDHNAVEEEDLRVFARAFAMPGRTRGGLEWYRAFPKDAADTRAWAKSKLTVPVLALGGEQRWGSVIVGMMQELAVDVRGGSLPDCNHWLAEEQPELLLKALIEFLG